MSSAPKSDPQAVAKGLLIALGVGVVMLLLLSGGFVTGYLLYTPTSSEAPSAPPGYKSFVSPEHDLSLAYPESWNLRKQFHGTVATVFPPTHPSRNWAFRVRCSVEHKFLVHSMTFSEYLRISKQNVKRKVDQLTLLDESFLTRDTMEMLKLRFRFRLRDRTVKGIGVLGMKNGQGYDIACSSLTDEFDRHEGSFRTIMDSFELRE